MQAMRNLYSVDPVNLESQSVFGTESTKMTADEYKQIYDFVLAYIERPGCKSELRECS